MSPHVAARLHGHGSIVLPYPGFRLERAEGELVLRIGRGDRSGVIDVRGDPTQGGDLCDLAPGTRQGPWRIETSLHACAWPAGFAIIPDPDAMSPFLLVGPDESLIWLNGPLESRRARPIEKLCGEGQRVRDVAESPDGGASRIDLDYEEQGEPWWQRRYAIAWGEGRAIVVSAQARRRSEELVRAAVDLVERTLEPLERR